MSLVYHLGFSEWDCGQAGLAIPKGHGASQEHGKSFLSDSSGTQYSPVPLTSLDHSVVSYISVNGMV